MADMAVLKAIVSLYCAGEEKPIERFETRVKVTGEIEDVTRWRKDMIFMFEWQNKISRVSAVLNATRHILHVKLP